MCWGREQNMKILAVIDMQKDFIDGALGTKEAVQIVDAVEKKVEEFLNAGDLVIYTRDTHQTSYLETQEGKNLPVVHCVEGTEGWQIHEKVYKEGCPIIDKPSFGSLELSEWVAAREDVNEIVVVGLCTDICVISNVMILKARLPEILISVAADCCAGVTPQSHQNALEAMKMCQVNIL